MITELLPETETTPPPRSRRRAWYVVGAGLAFVAVAAFVLAYFQPQKLFLDERVNEALPDLVVTTPAAIGDEATAPADAAAEPAAETPADDASTPASPAAEEPAPEATIPAPAAPLDPLAAATAEAARLGAPVAVTSGAFASLDHPTAGNAYLVVLPDGSRLLRIEDLRTDNGPDVRVVLSTAAVGTGDFGNLIELGRLKGNIGSQNYEIPAELDLTTIQSVVLWCERFSAPFGEAPALLGT